MGQPAADTGAVHTAQPAMSVTLDQAQSMVTLYLEAEQAVLRGKRAKLADRELTREDLGEIRAGRIEWENTVARLKSGAASRGPRIFGARV
jgi:hypothetical protein